MANYQSIHSGSNIDYVVSNALLQSSAASIYLTKTDAADTYLTQSNASNIYLTKADANTLYPLKDGTGATGIWNIDINGTLNGNLYNGHAYPSGTNDLLYHEVACFTQENNSQINTELSLLITNYYAPINGKGILTIEVRSEVNETSPQWIRLNWLIAIEGINPNNFIATWSFDNSTSFFTIKLYIKITGWASYNVTKLQEHHWGSPQKEWILYHAEYPNHAIASIPSNETQIVSTLPNLKNSANKLADNGVIGTDVRHDGRTIIVRPNDMPIVENVASYYSDTSSITGTMKITLPTTSGECIMQMMEVWIFDYNSNSGSILCIAGYTYNDNKWYNYSCRVLGHYSKGCRLAYDGTHACILLGTTSTVWNYPKVWIPRWMAGYGNRMSIVNKGLPTINIITSESGYTITGTAS